LPEREGSSQNSFLLAAEGGKKELGNRPAVYGSADDCYIEK